MPTHKLGDNWSRPDTHRKYIGYSLHIAWYNTAHNFLTPDGQDSRGSDLKSTNRYQLRYLAHDWTPERRRSFEP